MTEWILTSSILILIILGLRFLLRGKISPMIQYCLWGLVLVRLLVPFSISESIISVSNLLRQPVVQNTESDIRHYENIYDQIAEQHTQSGSVPTPSQIRQEALNQIYSDTYHNLSDKYSQDGSSVPDVQIQTEAQQQVNLIRLATMVTDVLPLIWYSGIAVVGCALLFSNLHFALRLGKNRKRLEAPDIPLPVYETDITATPCLFGLFRPVIYLTGEAAHDAGMRRHILIHELTHYRHRDHIWSLLRGVCMMLHWYNPLVWAAAILSKQDGELACDEAVIRALGEQERTAYGRTLISMTCIRRDAQNLLISATTMVGSKKTLKERITRIAQKPKTALYTLITCILVASLAVGCTFTGSLSTGLTKDEVWKKVLTAVEAYNNRDHYHISVVSAYEYGDDTPNGNLSNEFYQANGNEVRRFSAGDQVEIVLRYSGNMYVAVEGSEWHDFENSANLTDLSFQIPAEENLVLSWSQEGDQLVVVCDYSYQEPDEHALVDPTVTFWINADGNLDKYSYTYGVDTQNSTDYIHTVTFTVHADDAAGVNRKILNTYNEAAAALGLEPVDSIYSQDEIYEQLKAVVQEINSREAYHFKFYLTVNLPGEQDPTTNENFTQGWISGADMYVEQAYWGPVTPTFIRYDGNIYTCFDGHDIVWIQSTESTIDTDSYRITFPSLEDHTMTWSQTAGYLDISFVKNDDSGSGVLFRLDSAGALLWYAPYYQGMFTNQESGESYSAPVYSVLIYPDMDADAIRQHLDTVVPSLIADMEFYDADKEPPWDSTPLPGHDTLSDVVTAHEETFSWVCDLSHQHEISVSLPKILPFSKSAVSFQEQIDADCLPLLEELRLNQDTGTCPSLIDMDFTVGSDPYLLSIVVHARWDYDYDSYFVYNLDTFTGEHLTTSKMASRYLSVSYPEFLMAVSEYRMDALQATLPDTDAREYLEGFGTDICALDQARLYLDENGTLCLLYDALSLGGANYYPSVTPFSLDQVDWDPPSRDEAYAWLFGLYDPDAWIYDDALSDYWTILHAVYSADIDEFEWQISKTDDETERRILGFMWSQDSPGRNP